MFNLIVAFSENYVLGKNNKLIWRLSSDLIRFKKLTLNNVIIMGRKTFQSLPNILPNRYHIVISKTFNFFGPNVITKRSLHDTIKDLNINFLMKKVFIIGGEEIYRQSINFINTMYITKVHVKLDGDVFFPLFDNKEWKIVFSKFYKKDLYNEYDTTFFIYKRNNSDLK